MIIPDKKLEERNARRKMRLVGLPLKRGES
jgi:hypothetical protein